MTPLFCFALYDKFVYLCFLKQCNQHCGRYYTHFLHESGQAVTEDVILLIFCVILQI